MSNKIYVGNLPWATDEDAVHEHFKESGNVVKVTLIRDRDTNKLRGFGFVEFETASEAQKAITDKNEQPFQGKNLRVSIAKEQRSRGGSDRRGRGGNGGGGGNRHHW